MIWSIAWRNIWRSKTRSLVVIGAVIVAIWSLVFILAFMRGIIYDYIDNAVKYQTSHIQVHDPEYLEDNLIRFVIPEGKEVVQSFHSDPRIEAVSPRIVINTMIASSRGARGIQIRGVDTQMESAVIDIPQTMEEGAFLEGTNRNEIAISASMADKLKVGLRKKVVITFQAMDTEIATAAFRISGIFNTYNKQVDDFVAFVNIEDLRRVAGVPEGQYHEIGVKLQNPDSLNRVADDFQGMFPETIVRTYEEIAPELGLFKSQVRLNMIIMTSIIMLALIFGIINTMMMAVLERTREIGMLMAIGMRKGQIFAMIVVETLYVSVLGAPAGMLLGLITVELLSERGIDLSFWSQGMSEFGMSAIVHPVLGGDAYAIVAIAIVITALLASVSPALRAIRLRPVEAMHKI